ncbi:MAG: pre-peptidase C-terminal domain-containing protein, partial [Granulosicoccaceae bacterium]
MSGKFNMLQHRRLTVATLLSALFCTSCGGGGGSSSEGGVTGQGGSNVVLSGSSTVSDNVIADSDLNDPIADYASNNTAAEAQSGPNPGKVLGYLSAVGFGAAGGRFDTTADTLDVFSISLAAGQSVTVQMADWESGGFGTQDIDLFLYDANLNLLQSSEGVSVREQVLTQTSGEYYVVLEAYQGAGNYTLSIGSGENQSQRQTNHLSRLDNFVDGQAVVLEYASANFSLRSSSAGDSLMPSLAGAISAELVKTSSSAAARTASKTQMLDPLSKHPLG